MKERIQLVRKIVIVLVLMLVFFELQSIPSYVKGAPTGDSAIEEDGKSNSPENSTNAGPLTSPADVWKPDSEPAFVPPVMFEIDPSLEVTVWASTPLLYNPTNMDIDHAGRICDTDDKNSVEAIGLGAAKESAIWTAIKDGLKPGTPAEWPDSFARLTWRLWGAASIDDLKARSEDPVLSLKQRKFAVESLGFIDDARAAQAMLDLASNGSPFRGEAIAWLLRNLSGEWAKHKIDNELNEKGIYNPETITVNPSPVPVAPADSKLPSRVINEKYVSETLELADGNVVIGRVVPGDDRALELELVINLLQPEKTIKVAKADVVQRKTSPVSAMPSCLLDCFNEDEITDLIAYVLANQRSPK